MKVFVYSKKTNKILAKINHVEFVNEPESMAKIKFVDNEGNEYEYSTNEVKTCIYQN